MPLSCKTLAPLWVLCATGFLLGCSDPQHSSSQQVAAVPKPNATPSVASMPHKVADSAAYVFNVPALVNLTADQIRVKLGTPISDAQESINEQMKTLRYQRQGYKLAIDYEVQSRQLLDFYLKSSKPRAEYQYLLDAANVNQHDKRYKAEPLDQGDGLYSEIEITPGVERVLDSSGKWVPVEQPH